MHVAQGVHSAMRPCNTMHNGVQHKGVHCVAGTHSRSQVEWLQNAITRGGGGVREV